jgi:hypothetical protein
VTRIPPTHYASVTVRGPWWTDYEPSLRVPRKSGGSPASIWTTGDDGPNVLLVAPDAGTHDLWVTLSLWLRDWCTVHAMDRAGESFGDDVDQVATAADAVAAEYLVGFADDAAVLREATLRAKTVRRVLVLTAPGEPRRDGQLDAVFMRCVPVSSRDVGAFKHADAQRLIDSLRKGGE